MHNSLSQAALKATTKAIRSKQNAGSTRPIMAIFYDHRGKAYRQIRYAFIDTAIPKVSGHLLWLAVMHRIELVHIETGFQIGILTKNSKGQLSTAFCWEQSPKAVQGLLRPLEQTTY